MLVMQGGDSLVGGLPIIDITYQQYIANPSAYHSPGVIVHISGYPTAGNLPADYVGYDSNLNMEDIGNIATKAIAKVEPSDTALYLHEVGTGFINKDGNYCITDVQISVGGTITLGTNCHVVDGGISSNLIAVTYTPAEAVTFNGNSIIEIDVTSEIPANYYPIGATVARYQTPISDFSFLGLINISQGTPRWVARLRNDNAGNTTARPKIHMICKRN